MEIYRKVLQFSTNRNLLLKRHPLFDFLTSDVLFTIFSLTLKTGKRRCPILSGINISALRSPDAPHDEHHPGPTTLQPGVQQPSVPRSVTSPPSLSLCNTCVQEVRWEDTTTPWAGCIQARPGPASTTSSPSTRADNTTVGACQVPGQRQHHYINFETAEILRSCATDSTTC